MSIDIIANQEVIPEIESRVFEGHEFSRFAVGIVAVGSEVVPELEGEFQGYTLLRGNVYAGQKNYMPASELNADGTETDADDARSVHFAVFENATPATKVVGSMRLIIKGSEDDRPLPVEDHYPEVFADAAAPGKSTESSRLISRHENRGVQKGIKWLLFTAGVSYIVENDLGPVFGAVERPLARGLAMEGMPVQELAEPKFVEEFNASKQPIKIDIDELAHRMKESGSGLLEAMSTRNGSFVYTGNVHPTGTSAPAA
jgi:N-acyl-L-homoserine lactone synthetase